MIDIMLGNDNLTILSNQQIIQLDAYQFKHLRLAEKVSLPGSTLLKVSNGGIVCKDPLQGLQILSTPKLALTKLWRFIELREHRYRALSEKYTLY